MSVPPCFFEGGSYGAEMADHFGTITDTSRKVTLTGGMVPLSHYGGTIL
ncbi:MAG: hypothetical protein ACLRJV_08195 [Eubacteriales bacterium]